MKTVLACLLAILLGIGLGIAVGALRIASAPWEGLSALNPAAGSNAELPSDTPTPKVVVDKLDYNFGTLDIEKNGKHEFTVSNQGNALLKITKGETTCRCATGDLEKSELPPGESTQLRLNWRPTAEVGPYEQTASFYTNDPLKPKFTIKISGKITATLRILPAALVLSRISANETTQGSVTVLSFLDQPLEIKSYRFEDDPTSKFFDLSLTPLSEDELKGHAGAKSGYLATVKIKPGLPQGTFRQRIVLETNNPDNPERVISVDGAIGYDISVVGPAWDSEHNLLYLGTVKSEEGLHHRLLLIVRGPYRKETHFTLAEKPPVPLKVTLGDRTEINDGQVTQTPLVINIPKDSPRASHLGHSNEKGEDTTDDETSVIRINTTHPEIPQLRIPVRFAVEQ
jgi:hypothetical protein